MKPPADVSCSENIAFLHLLHEVPAPPSKNEAGQVPIRPGNYTMSFDRERQFVGACALLSCIRADNMRIPAVCVQEVPETGSLDLLVAVNRRNVDTGPYLNDMKAGFERVFRELSRVETGRWRCFYAG